MSTSYNSRKLVANPIWIVAALALALLIFHCVFTNRYGYFRDCGIFAQHYGLAGAMDFFAPRYGLPRVYLSGVICGSRYNALAVDTKDLIEVDPEKMSGAPCFTGTRVPLTHLFDYLEAGDTLDDFLTDFPSVTRDQALGLLELIKKRILTDYETAA